MTTSPGHLIAVCGVDCVGKSTQIERLRRALEADGHRVVVLWHRPGYSRGLDRARNLVRRFRPSVLPAPGRSAARDATFARPGVARAWRVAAVLDTLAVYGWHVRRLVRTGHVVICDRYVEDALLDLELRFPGTAKASGPTLLRAACPLPDASLLLTLPWPQVQARTRTKAEPFPDADDVRRHRYLCYAALADSGRVTVIDGRGTPDEVEERIRRAVSPVVAPTDDAR